jgi:hypothetical protein
LTYVKFDLLDESLRELPDLSAAARAAGAETVSLVARTSESMAARALDEAVWSGVALRPRTSCLAIKIPSLEGTELHVVSHACQPDYERCLGFEKPSEPVLALEAEKLLGQKVRVSANYGEAAGRGDAKVILSDEVDASSGAAPLVGGSGSPERALLCKRCCVEAKS